jgi:thiol peroxidase
MATVRFKGTPVHTSGELPAVGALAPDVTLTNADLADVAISTWRGKRVVLNIFPSLDTGTCAMSVRRFNAEAVKMDNTVVLCVSRDLPFAQARFCGAEGLKNVVTLSDMRAPDFGKKYGVTLTDGPLAGLFARAVVVLDVDGKVMYAQLVEEIANEPDYQPVVQLLGKK